MNDTPRVTGDNPPPRYWAEFPNWEVAYDEEGVEDQDDTTLRPSSNQTSIDDGVCQTVGKLVLADGTEIPALIALVDQEIDCVYVYPDPNNESCWSMDPEEPGQWEADPEGDAELSLLPFPAGFESNVPFTIRSRLPLQRTGKPIEEVVRSITL